MTDEIIFSIVAISVLLLYLIVAAYQDWKAKKSDKRLKDRLDGIDEEFKRINRAHTEPFIKTDNLYIYLEEMEGLDWGKVRYESIDHKVIKVCIYKGLERKIFTVVLSYTEHMLRFRNMSLQEHVLEQVLWRITEPNSDLLAMHYELSLRHNELETIRAKEYQKKRTDKKKKATKKKGKKL